MKKNFASFMMLLLMLPAAPFLMAQASPATQASSATQASPATPVVQDVHENVRIKKSEKTLKTHWNGRRVALLGDSMTDKRTLGPDMLLWWEYLSELLGFDATYNYGRSGRQWHQIHLQAQTLWQDHGQEVDAILIFAGTNDYNAGVPIGEFFTYEEVPVEVKGPKIEVRKHRIPVMGDSTLCGRLNTTLCYLKTQYPDKSIVIMTPIHRGYAKFNEKNVQPDEYYCNAQGKFLEDYVQVIKQAAAYWSVPVVDLYANAGIIPNLDAHVKFIQRAANDRLHPSTEGQYRIAKVMQYALPTIY